MKWFVYLLLVIFVGALTYQYLVNRNGGLQITTPSNMFTGGVNAPGFEGGGTWIGSKPLDLKELLKENKLVLVDFWTYSCINCQRTLPYLKQWWEKYKDKGLIIVGVHSPEFEFEKVTSNVESAMKKYGVTWPVVQDNDHRIWSAYANQYWPAKYLINVEGKIIYTHFGEGEYEETEKVIRDNLQKQGYDLSGIQLGQDNKTGSFSGQSPETYLGYLRGRIGNGDQVAPDELKVYSVDGSIAGDLAYFDGEWKVGQEMSITGKNAALEYKFTGGEVNLVMGSDVEKKVKVFVDGQEIKTVTVKDRDLYNLYKGDAKTATLRLEFEEGIEAYAFTFGQ
jgi:thiol-disulfide isomerase/thioredoxin